MLPEPASGGLSAQVLTSAGGLMIAGVATGLSPDVMVAGFWGGVFAVTALPAGERWWAAPVKTIGSSVLAGYTAPALAPIAMHVLQWIMPGDLAVPDSPMRLLTGFAVGYFGLSLVLPKVRGILGRYLDRAGGGEDVS